MFAFLAAHRGDLFGDADFADLFPSGKGRPSVPASVMASVMVLQVLHDYSDAEAAEAARCDLRWKAACGFPLDHAGFDPSTLVYWRRRLAKSGRPYRISDAVRRVIEETGVLKGRRRRAVDSTILADAVATQDTITQLVSAIRRCARLVPGAAELIASVCTGHDYSQPGKPRIDWDDPAAKDWADVTGDADKARARLATLAQVLQQHLQIVAINLSASDDDQLIFETLNDRGTPLLAADLIKNYVFQQCEQIGADVDTWSETYWQDFDEDWWRDQVAQGRLYRSRIDLFLQYWLTMRLHDEIPSEAVFARFRTFADSHLHSAGAAEAFLKSLRHDASAYRDLVTKEGDSPAAGFYMRVVEDLELGSFIPLLLWLISDNHDVPDAEISKALNAVESMAVRRTLLRMTAKDINSLVVAALKYLDGVLVNQVGEAVKDFLARQTADSRSWPTDDDLREQLPSIRLYGNVKQPRLRVILSALELRRRTDRHESVTLPYKLEIEHVMPRGWRTHWGADISGDAELAAQRDFRVDTLGNLTLATRKLNGALSNRPWRDADAAAVASTGREAGVGKRSLLNRYSVLVLNKDIVEQHADRWTEDDILARSRQLTETVIAIWPRPVPAQPPVS